MISFFILIMTSSYILGSISSAILICKILRIPDPRNMGSRNPGCTNTFRIAGIKISLYVMLFDTLKGTITIWLGLLLQMSSTQLGIMAVCVCLGHMYPIFFRFNGGKGIATTFGSLIMIDFNLSIIMLSVWIIIVLLSKFPSLGSIITTITTPFYIWCNQPQYLFPIIIISILILLKHTENIKRLWYHQEKRIW